MNYAATDPLGRWVGLGRPLHALEVDYNFYNHETRITSLEASVTTTVSISSVTQPTATQMQINLSNSASYTLTMPTATFVDRGAWLPTTAYFVNDTFTANGSLYRVLRDHTSASTFSPTANDGAGHDYYAAMMSNPGNALPAGGGAGMFLKKSTSTDYAVSWSYALPNGGTTNQVLAKLGNTDQNFGWLTLGATMVSFTPSTASALVSTDVASALEELETLLSGIHGVSALADCTDVHFSTGSPVEGSLLYFGGTKWAASATPSNGDVAMWNGAAWAPTATSGLGIRFTDITGSLTVSQLRYTTITSLGTSGAITLDPTLGNVFVVVPAGNLSITATSVQYGAEITVIIVTNSGTSFNIDFSTGTFKSQGTLATGTSAGKYFTVKFVGTSIPGSWWVETGRISTGM